MRFSSPHMSIIIIVILLPTVILGRHIDRRHSNGHSSHFHGLGRQTIVAGLSWQKESYNKGKKMRQMERRPSTVLVAGSSLPNCSHACGSCSPCRLVMVSFICEEEAETCPMAYKCMCNSKSYPVP